MEVKASAEVRLIKASKRAAKASKKKGKKTSVCGQKAADFWRGMKKADDLDVYGALASHMLANMLANKFSSDITKPTQRILIDWRMNTQLSGCLRFSPLTCSNGQKE